VVAGNRIDGVTEGIMVTANEPGVICRNNVIRDNTIAIRRAHPPTVPGPVPIHDEADSTVVGVPLALRGLAGESTLEDNLIEGNVIVGAEGLGIEVRNASRNRIVNNTVTRVVRREPFPGNTIAALPILGGAPDAWRDANGSGIWVSPGSDGNEIVGNIFEEIAGSAVVIQGDNNQVEVQGEDDAVRDLGTGNRVTRADGGARVTGATVPQDSQAAALEGAHRFPHEIVFVTVAPGVQLEVLDWGGEGTPLVFLAGANFNAHSFDDFAPRFTDTHRVLGITRRGHGASTWPDSGYDLPTLVEDIRVVLDSLGIDRAILAGHSMAGSEMTLLATESPDRVAGLIYIDAGHDPTDIERLRVPELCSIQPRLARGDGAHIREPGAGPAYAVAHG
jgi:parallel beta-helix repeat protein